VKTVAKSTSNLNVSQKEKPLTVLKRTISILSVASKDSTKESKKRSSLVITEATKESLSIALEELDLGIEVEGSEPPGSYDTGDDEVFDETGEYGNFW